MARFLIGGIQLRVIADIEWRLGIPMVRTCYLQIWYGVTNPTFTYRTELKIAQFPKRQRYPQVGGIWYKTGRYADDWQHEGAKKSISDFCPPLYTLPIFEDPH